MLLKNLLILGMLGVYCIASDFKLKDYSVLIDSTNSLNITNRPAFVVFGDAAINEVIYRYMQFPTLMALKKDYEILSSTHEKKDYIQEKIITNIVIKWETKEKIVEIKNKKRVIIVAVISSILSAALAGWSGYKIHEKIIKN